MNSERTAVKIDLSKIERSEAVAKKELLQGTLDVLILETLSLQPMRAIARLLKAGG